MVGRSIRQIVWARLRRDRIAMICLLVLIAYYLIGMLGPIVGPALGLDPYAFDRAAISIVAGYAGGKVDLVIGRFMDLVLAFPFILIVLALSNVLTDRIIALGVPPGTPSRIVYLILVISVFGWPYLARIVRGQVISLREREFVEAAVSMGSSRRRILFTEILPNLWAPIIVYTTLLLPAYIGFEAALSFLGVGGIPPDTTFGAMLANSVNYFTNVPSYLFIPGTILAILVVSFNLLGDALRDALDPRVTR